MEEFFAKMGNKKLKFKPAFNPYTEVCYPTPGWVELTN
jgi:phenylalanyl-tRNA synthetase alpha subunit